MHKVRLYKCSGPEKISYKELLMGSKDYFERLKIVNTNRRFEQITFMDYMTSRTTGDREVYQIVGNRTGYTQVDSHCYVADKKIFQIMEGYSIQQVYEALPTTAEFTKREVSPKGLFDYIKSPFEDDPYRKLWSRWRK